MSTVPVLLAHDPKSPFTTPEKKSPQKSGPSNWTASSAPIVARRALSFMSEELPTSTSESLGAKSISLLRSVTPLSTSSSDEGSAQTPLSMLTPRSPFLRELQTPTPTKRDRLGPDPFGQRDHPHAFLHTFELMSDEQIVEQIQSGCLTPHKLEPFTKNSLGANRLIHFIWLGQELSNPDLMQNIANWSNDLKGQGYQVLLWTNRTSASTEFLEWCAKSNVHLVSVYQAISEVDFLETFAHFEHSVKKVPPNYGEASDILRLVLLYQLGGIYLDCDAAKKVEGRAIGISQDFEALTNSQNLGLKINAHGLPECNDCIMARANNPFIHHLLTQIPLSYEKSIVDLIRDFPRSYLHNPDRHWEITHTMARTGPSFILKLFREYFSELSLEDLLKMRIAYEGHDQTGDWHRNRKLTVSQDIQGVKTVLTSILAELEQNPHSFDMIKYAHLFEKLGFVEDDRLVFICSLLDLFEKKEMIDFIHVQSKQEYEAVECIIGKKCYLHPEDVSEGCDSDDGSTPVGGRKSPWASPLPLHYKVEPRKSPLLSAIEHENMEMVRFLLEERDACPISTIYHQSLRDVDIPLAAALMSRNKEMIDYVVGQILVRSYGIEHIATIVTDLIELDNLEIMRLLLDKHFPNEQAKTIPNRDNPLFKCKSMEIFEYLHACGFPLVMQIGYAAMILDISLKTYTVPMMERFIELLASSDASLFANCEEPDNERTKKKLLKEYVRMKFLDAQKLSLPDHMEKLTELLDRLNLGS